MCNRRRWPVTATVAHSIWPLIMYYQRYTHILMSYLSVIRAYWHHTPLVIRMRDERYALWNCHTKRYTDLNILSINIRMCYIWRSHLAGQSGHFLGCKYSCSRMDHIGHCVVAAQRVAHIDRSKSAGLSSEYRLGHCASDQCGRLSIFTFLREYQFVHVFASFVIMTSFDCFTVPPLAQNSSTARVSVRWCRSKS